MMEGRYELLRLAVLQLAEDYGELAGDVPDEGLALGYGLVNLALLELVRIVDDGRVSGRDVLAKAVQAAGYARDNALFHFNWCRGGERDGADKRGKTAGVSPAEGD